MSGVISDSMLKLFASKIKNITGKSENEEENNSEEVSSNSYE